MLSEEDRSSEKAMQSEVNELTACALRERPSISCVDCDENLSVSKNPQKKNSLNGTADSVDFDSILDVLPEFTGQVSDSHMKDVPGSQQEPKDHRCPSFGVFGKASTKRNHRKTHVDVVHGEDKPDKLNGRMAKQVDLDDTDPSKFPCGTCEIIFDDPATLSDHAIRFHQGRNAYRCHVCEVPFFSVRGVIRHETTFHNIANPDFPVKSPKPPTESCESPAKNRKGRRKTNPEIRRKQPESRKSAPFCNFSRVPEEPSFTVDGINFLESLMTEKKRKRRRHAEIPSLPMVPTHIEPPSAGVGAMAAALNSVFKGLVPTVFTHCPVKPKHNAAPKTTERVQPGAEVNSPRMKTVTNHQLAGNSEAFQKADPMVIRPLVLDEVNIRSTASEPILARLKAEQTASNCPYKSPTKYTLPILKNWSNHITYVSSSGSDPQLDYAKT
ncbi:unnamed protein product [Calicophoron daubneyi]|uniref:C2H2-type domain-containing protein n=1 Tax=Calicophoron daubneyi TaxID=300641 RepID=A0AAV2TFK3_CALDB